MNEFLLLQFDEMQIFLFLWSFLSIAVWNLGTWLGERLHQALYDV